MNKTQQDLGAAQSTRAEARARLAQALGVGLAALDGVKLEPGFSADVPAALTAAEARGVALRGRADVLGALADYAAAEADVHLNPGYQYDQGDSKWSLGLSVDLPVLNQNQGPIAEAEARRKLAAAKFLALQARVSGEIDRAVAGVRVAREQLETGKKLIAAEMQRQKSAEAQLQAGAGERLDLLNAQLETSNASVTQLDNEAKLQAAIGALEDALQSPGDQIAAAIEKNSSENPSHSSK